MSSVKKMEQRTVPFVVPSTGIEIETVMFNLVRVTRQVGKRMESEGLVEPRPPMVEVTIGKKTKAQEPDFSNEAYQRATVEYWTERGVRCMDAVMFRLSRLQKITEERGAAIAGQVASRRGRRASGEEIRRVVRRVLAERGR